MSGPNIPDSLILPIGDLRPEIAEDAFVAPGSFITGAVTLRSQASVWYGASLRADTTPVTIGERSNVQDNACMHADPGYPCLVGDDVTIGHAAVVHGCTIGDRVTIGMGAVIMNGAVVGDECLIAGGAVIPEGVEIPAGSLVAGVPGKVRRELSAEERSGLGGGAARYVENAARHRDALDRA